MRSAQDYRDKAAAAERLANDLRQPAELRSELRGIAQNWLIGLPVLLSPKSRAGEGQLGRGARCSDNSFLQRASAHS